MNAKVGILNGGSWALAKGKAANEAAIVNVRNKAIAVSILLLVIFLSPFIIVHVPCTVINYATEMS
jgi:hypothetical protein